MTDKKQIIIVGGGLAGLVAANRAADEGADVTLLEGGKGLGGRALTQVQGGYHFNMGPHALYVNAAGAPILKRLGIEPKSNPPPLDGALAISRGSLTSLPATTSTLIKSKALGTLDKLELGKALAALPKVDTAVYDSVSFASALEEMVKRPRVRTLLEAVARLTSYAHAPNEVSGGAVLDQIAAGNHGVLYLDHGWQSLVDALADRALEAGASIRTQVKVERVEEDENGVRILTKAGEELRADCAVLAVPPNQVRLLNVAFNGIETDLVPSRLASLDLGLTYLPLPARRFALGIDDPYYLSVHSATASLAPEGAALVHVARYIAPEEDLKPAELEAELEAVVDLVQPGWREAVAERLFRPNLTVTHTIPLARNGGLKGRPAVANEGRLRLFLAGDWVGDTGMLADAAIASGDKAGSLAAETARTAADEEAARPNLRRAPDPVT